MRGDEPFYVTEHLQYRKANKASPIVRNVIMIGLYLT